MSDVNRPLRRAELAARIERLRREQAAAKTAVTETAAAVDAGSVEVRAAVEPQDSTAAPLDRVEPPHPTPNQAFAGGPAPSNNRQSTAETSAAGTNSANSTEGVSTARADTTETSMTSSTAGAAVAGVGPAEADSASSTAGVSSAERLARLLRG